MSEREDQDKKRDLPRFTLTPPPPPPPSIEEITRGSVSTSRFKDAPPAPPAIVRTGEVAPLTPPPEFTPLQVPATFHDDVSVQLNQEIARLQQVVAQKDAELDEFHASFAQIQDQLKDVGDLIRTKDIEIEQLRGTMDLIQAELKNKDASLFRAKAKIDVLEESLAKVKQEAMVSGKKLDGLEAEKKALDGEIQLLKRENADLKARLDATSSESTSEIEQLRAEKFQINERLSKRMDEVAYLEGKVKEKDAVIVSLNDRLDTLVATAKDQDAAKPAGQARAIAGTFMINGRDTIIGKINELLDGAMHNVLLVVPSIQELKEIDLVKLKSHVKVQVACKIDMKSQSDLDLYQNYRDLNKVEFRSFDWGDRFGINVDRGVVLVGVNSKQEPFGIITTDEQGIDLLVKNFLIETWTIGRKL